MKKTATVFGRTMGVRKDQAAQSSLHAHFAEGHLGRGDRADRRLSAGLWLKGLYDQCYPSKESLARPGLAEPDPPPFRPPAARRDLFERAAAAMGPEFGVLFQA